MGELTFPRLCALLADRPTKLSLAMHSAGFKALNLPFVYFTVDTVDTENALLAMRSLGIRGYSLTIPHKEAALAYIDEVSDSAAAIGAVNTVVNDGNRLSGDNTDVLGIENALEEAEFDIKGKRLLIYGAGGAARAALFLAKRSKASQTFISNRTVDRGEKLAAEFSANFIPPEQLEKHLPNIDLFINSTPIGSNLLADNAQSFPFPMDALNASHTVFDFVTYPTRLTQAAHAQGARTIEGSRMLLHQALRQFELFTDAKAPRSVMEKALRDELNLLVSS